MRELAVPSRPLVDDEVALRPWYQEDSPVLAAMCREEAIVRWTRVPANYGERDAHAHMRRAEEERRAGRGVYFAVVDARSGELLGACDLRISPSDAAVAEVAFFLGARARGRGVMTRAVRLIARWGFHELDLARITLLTHPENVAAARVAQLAGFTREGLFRAYREKHGRREDRVVFSLLPQDLA